MEPGILPGSHEFGHAYASARMSRVSAFTICASTPRPAACTRLPDTPVDAGILPATSVAFRMLVGFVLGGPPGRGMARPPPASCGLTGRAMDDRSAGVLAGGAPTSDNLTDQCAIDRRATPRVARRCAVFDGETRHIRARAGPCPIRREPGMEARLSSAPSRIRGRRQDAADAAQSPAARRAAKTNPPTVRIATVAAGRTPASIGVSGILVRAAGRGVDAKC